MNSLNSCSCSFPEPGAYEHEPRIRITILRALQLLQRSKYSSPFLHALGFERGKAKAFMQTRLAFLNF
jgi:hypothetical protein